MSIFETFKRRMMPQSVTFAKSATVITTDDIAYRDPARNKFRCAMSP